jgi:hypothetical protein
MKKTSGTGKGKGSAKKGSASTGKAKSTGKNPPDDRRGRFVSDGPKDF